MWNGLVKVTVWCPLLGLVRAWARQLRRGQRGAPAAQRGRTTLTSTILARCWRGRGAGSLVRWGGLGAAERRRSAGRHPDVRGAGPQGGGARGRGPHLFGRAVGPAFG